MASFPTWLRKWFPQPWWCSSEPKAQTADWGMHSRGLLGVYLQLFAAPGRLIWTLGTIWLALLRLCGTSGCSYPRHQPFPKSSAGCHCMGLVLDSQRLLSQIYSSICWLWKAETWTLSLTWFPLYLTDRTLLEPQHCGTSILNIVLGNGCSRWSELAGSLLSLKCMIVCERAKFWI